MIWFIIQQHCIAERLYTIETLTVYDPYPANNPGTDDNIYLTMYDATGNACAERLLWHGTDPFQNGA